MGDDKRFTAPYHTGSRHPGLRGRALAALRISQGVGQRHQAEALGLTQPELSAMERERFGGLPRGFSSRYQDTLARIVADGERDCHKRCGCRKGRGLVDSDHGPDMGFRSPIG